MKVESKVDILDDSQEEFASVPIEQILFFFLIKEFEKILLETNSPSNYVMDMYEKDLTRKQFMSEKYQYRKRRIFSLHTEVCNFVSNEDLNFL